MNDYLGKLFETNFNELGLGVSYVKGYESPLGNTYLYNLQYISQYNKKYLQSLLEKIAIYHHFDLKLIDTKEAHFGIIDTTNTKQVIPLSQYVFGREITIGLDNYGRQVHLDFDKIPHLLIAGTTGSGKSVLLHNIILNLIIHYGSNRFKIPQYLIIDPKGTELNCFRQVKKTTYVDDTNQAINVLNRAVEIMEERYRNPYQKYTELFIIIDELADLMLTSKYQVEESIVRLAQKGRACGIHLIVATQRPTIDVCSGLIKANMPYRIGLKTASIRDSIVILDHKGLEELKGCGDSIVKLGLQEYHTQIAYPEKEFESKIILTNRG